MSDALLKNTFNKISPAYELVADVTVGVATTQVDFSGLNFGKDDDLLLVSDWVNGGSTSTLRMTINDLANTSFYRQRLSAYGTTVDGARANTNDLDTQGANFKMLSTTKIKSTNSGYVIFQHDCELNYGSSSTMITNSYVSTTPTVTSITKISLITSVSNMIAIGSRFQLYRLKAKKVADIIVGSATTQVDITGLSIDKDSEYMLEITSLTTGGVTNLFANGNTTPTNYCVQTLIANGTSVTANRYNAPYINEVGNPAHFSINLKLTNNGYFVAQSNHIVNMGGSTVILGKNYITSTFTSTSITSLRLTSSVDIPIGSRFTLYKMI